MPTIIHEISYHEVFLTVTTLARAGIVYVYNIKLEALPTLRFLYDEGVRGWRK